MHRAQRLRRPTARVPSRSRAAALALPVAAGALALWPGVAAAASEGGGLQLLPHLPSRALAEMLGAPYGFHLVWLLVLFTLLTVPVDRFIFRPLLRVLDERESRIAGTRARAEKLEREAAAVLSRYQTSLRETREESERERRALLDEVRAEAARETGAARAEAEQRIEQARAEVNAALESARESLGAQARDLARQAASQVLGRAL